VKVKCFECAALMEADDSDALARAFVAHGNERHAWSYPEDAIRNYACNYAEATERLTGGTERLVEIADVTVHPVTEDRVDDWLRFFDHDAFAGNPDWASCYCLEPHVPATPEQPERAWRDTRATVAGRLRGGTTLGYLAYVDGQPVGWVNASFRSNYGLYRLVDPDGPEPRCVIRSLVLRHRPAVSTARGRLGIARSRYRGRFRPRCFVDRGVSAQRAQGERCGPFPRPTVHI
jgi:hypothetical protein